jgi:hypothetical protein
MELDDISVDILHPLAGNVELITAVIGKVEEPW